MVSLTTLNRAVERADLARIYDGKLRALNLQNMAIEQLDRLSCVDIVVRELNLSGNNLRHLRGIEQFYHLEKLDLANNRISQPDELRYLSNLDIFELNLTGNPVERDPTLKEKVLKQCKKLKRFNGKAISDLQNGFSSSELLREGSTFS